jgi:hypothetical protein
MAALQVCVDGAKSCDLDRAQILVATTCPGLSGNAADVVMPRRGIDDWRPRCGRFHVPHALALIAFESGRFQPGQAAPSIE